MDLVRIGQNLHDVALIVQVPQVLLNGVFEVQGLAWRGLPDSMADKYQFLAGFIPSHSHARGIVVLDADVDANK